LAVVRPWRRATMRITCEPDQELARTHRVHLDGQLDAIGATHFWDVVGDRITGETPHLLLDMGDVRYVSSAGLGALFRGLTRVQQAGGGLAMYACNSRVQTILKVVGVYEVLNVRETAGDARARLTELGAGAKGTAASS
jgi:anti-anti-sigma factor